MWSPLPSPRKTNQRALGIVQAALERNQRGLLMAREK
jgi:hypothetical protein